MENKEILATQEFLLRAGVALKIDSISLDMFTDKLIMKLKKAKLKMDRKQKLNQINANK